MKIRSALGIYLSSLLLCSCSSVLNTVSGLTTLQSTISGSTYPFFVKKNGQLSLTNDVTKDDLIGVSQNFEITLDAGFLRYLQASDPYVLVYSKAWIGDKPPPTDDNAYLRQIILIKEGMGFNARLPLSSLPLLGPITMGSKLSDVRLSLHVVVLSKQSNAETTKLLDNLAGIVGTAQPQYAVIAGAAAAIGDAIIKQNKDKIEFEHNYKFTALADDSLNDGRMAQSTPTLSVGRHVVIKGEDENRLVPYDNWFFYISPFNWLGHKPSIESTRFEMKKGFWDLPYEDANMTLVNAPFKLLHQLVLPNESLLGRYNRLGSKDFFNKESSGETKPTELVACGAFLIEPEKMDKDVCSKGIGEDFFDRLYTQKTYAIISIKRTDTTYGEHDSLLNKFTEQAKLIDELSYTPTQDAQNSGVLKLQKILAYEATKKNLTAAINSGSPISSKQIGSVQSNKNLSDEERNALLNDYVEGQSNKSVKRLVRNIRVWLSAQGKTYKSPDFRKFVKRAVILEKAPWDKVCKANPTLINGNWNELLESVKIGILALENPNAVAAADDFASLIKESDTQLKDGCK